VLSRHLGENSKEIINLNPAYVAEKPKKNEYNIKSSTDVVSKLKPIHKKDIEIKAETSNPLTEHSSEILNRLDQDLLIGKGKNNLSGGVHLHPNMLKVFQIKEIINLYNKGKEPEEKIKGYSNKNKAELLKLLTEKYKLNTFDFDVKDKNPVPYKRYASLADPRAKYGKKNKT
jgi:hypothetical protein